MTAQKVTTQTDEARVTTSYPRAPIRRTLRLLRPVVFVAIGIAVIVFLLNVFVGLYTNVLWFRSIGFSSVYHRRLLTQILLFCLFGVVMAVLVAVNLVIAHRAPPRVLPARRRDWLRDPYARFVVPHRRWLTAVVAVVTGVVTGFTAAGRWQTWLQWRNAVPFGTRDPQFHRDYSYYVFVYPFHRFLLGMGFAVVIVALVCLLLTAYLNGNIRLAGVRPRVTPRTFTHLSLLLGLLAVLKAIAYWLDRYGTAVSNRGVVTGPSYADVHAAIPGKVILLIIAAIVGGLFFANVWVRGWKLPALGIGVLVVAGVIIGGIVPALVQQFQVRPNAQQAEAKYIARNIAATRYAYGIGSGVVHTDTTFAGRSTATQSERLSTATNSVQARLLDPNLVAPTFTQLQQERAFYRFKSTLDVDRYVIDGHSRDVDIAVRELTLSGLPKSQQNWTDRHLVYTHGNGVVAAPTDSVDARGEPAFVESGLPSSGVLGGYEPRIYFGQQSPSYSIVGAAPGARPREVDLPAANGTGRQVNNTYAGKGGVPIGSLFRQLLYAWQFGDKNIVFSSAVNSHSQLLYRRDPRQRVSQVAPWLTLDGDPYPVVVGGRILWVVDGYTTANTVPYSQQQNLKSATSTTFVTNGATTAQSSQSVNYIRNSVKATVDAYDGTVRLYEWDQPSGHRDPILATWMKAFPGLVKPQSAIPADLLAHLRYPQDLFNVQRQMLTRYHIVDPQAFYSGTNYWAVPIDPSVTANVKQPSYYMTMAAAGSGPGQFRLGTSFVSLNRRSLAAYLSVDSEPGPDYGQMTLLDLPSSNGIEGPGQIHNDIESDPAIAQQLTLLRSGGSQVVLGNLQSVPLDGQVLYIEPIYTRAAGGTSFPILREVVAVYNGTIAYDPSLSTALSVALGNGGHQSAPAANTPLARAVAAAQLAASRAQAALKAGDTAAYAREERALRQALAQIAAAATVTSSSATGKH